HTRCASVRRRRRWWLCCDGTTGRIGCGTGIVDRHRRGRPGGGRRVIEETKFVGFAVGRIEIGKAGDISSLFAPTDPAGVDRCHVAASSMVTAFLKRSATASTTLAGGAGLARIGAFGAPSKSV